MTAIEACQAVRAVLTPDLLSPAWAKRVKKGDPPGAGHCYIAAEAVWHLLGAHASGYRPMVIRGHDRRGRWTHWFLRNAYLIVDPTADQHTGNYGRGRGCGFLTPTPSGRCQRVLHRVQASAALTAAHATADAAFAYHHG